LKTKFLSIFVGTAVFTIGSPAIAASKHLLTPAFLVDLLIFAYALFVIFASLHWLAIFCVSQEGPVNWRVHFPIVIFEVLVFFAIVAYSVFLRAKVLG
jgi:NADH:ubiquinone oxidoreductase subunit K